MADEMIEIEAESFGEAVRIAGTRLGVESRELGLEVLDAGSSAGSSAGFRPVRVKAWRRSGDAPPDGAGSAPPSDRRPGRSDWSRGPRRPDDGPPPPPLDPSLVTPEMVEQVRGIASGILEHAGFEGTAKAELTRDGIRVAVDAGERDQFLIGKDGETLAAFQHLIARMLRAKTPGGAIPRVELDVAGYRDKKTERLRELARELMKEVGETGEEVSTDPLMALERRVVHLEVAERPEFTTVSVGEGLFKRVVVRRRDSTE
jgi:predicted RNA-binding protein Jag